MIWSLFGQNKHLHNKQRHPALPNLDDTLYPLHWHSQTFLTANDLLLAIIKRSAHSISINDNHSNGENCNTKFDNNNIPLDQKDMSRILYNNEVYQSWINFTVFGRYVQRSFAAFYRQSEDIFNADMPDLLRHELMRHAQYLPNGQTLFFAGQLPFDARTNKLFTTTLNPVTAMQDAATLTASKQQVPQCIINQVTINSSQVLGFAVKHNARTSERLRNEVMILNFQTLRQASEETINNDKNNGFITLRYFELT